MEVAYKIKLGRRVEAKLATVGKFDGIHPSIACASGKTGQVLVYDPHELVDASSSAPQLRVFNFNKPVTALACGPLRPGRGLVDGVRGTARRGTLPAGGADAVRDVLLVGLASAVLAYDVELNADIFFKEVQDGVHALCFGLLAAAAGCLPEPLVLVGGNCSVVGFDVDGVEKFWTVAGDTVSAVCMANDGDLLVGSDDFEVKVFRGDEVVCEVTEADKIFALAGLQQGRYAYGLCNGTVGVYHGKRRLWRIKSKQQLVALDACDLVDDAGGGSQVVAAWSNGSLTVRSAVNGSVLFKDSFRAGISQLLRCDLRADASRPGNQVVAVASDGEVRGYVAATPQAGSAAGGEEADAIAKTERECAELQSRKRDLLLELRRAEEAVRAMASHDEGGAVDQTAIPHDTRVDVSVRTGADGVGYDLAFETNNGCVIVAVIVADADSGLFDGETLLSMPSQPQATCAVALSPRKNVAAQLKIQIHVAARASATQLHVLEVTQTLPKFCCFVRVDDPSRNATPTGFVQFSCTAQVAQLQAWIEVSFVNMGRVEPGRDGSLQAHYVAVPAPGSDRGSGASAPLWIECRRGDGALQVKVSCAALATAAEVVQDLASFMQLSELESVSDFPGDLAVLRGVLGRVAAANALRMQLTAGMADGSHRIKTLVVKAEDARLMADMPLMRRHYAELFSLNGELVAEYAKRATNHAALLSALKEVNQVVQRAANLRRGTAKARVVSDARAAIKANNVQALYAIVKSGKAQNKAQ
ncbi:ciliary BBSome complex subunit 2 [Pelagophyceae sp. CCMP2097]|nr:ciliary BBSome complex subunit 2 [Pelagophyceae sp. CCMP2097]|mmetsp:Transcript_21286/g.72098  ORF Transcript_21286/g.72098 Transcript_21286/m.72098 type:complete len:758 (-) Transcript_21286:389-2662(-)